MAPQKGSEPGRRNPTVLVTDSRDQQSQRPGRRPAQPATRLITVDNVLQYASDVPSMQQRRPPQQRPQMRPRSRLSASGGLSSGASVPGTATAGRLAAQARLPPRSTKVTEKLVLLPETHADELAEEEDDRSGGGGRDGAEDELVAVDEELVQKLAQERNLDPDTLRERLELAAKQRLQGDFSVDNDLAPLLAEEEALRQRFVSPEKAKSYAERLPKARRAERLPRVTAYCTAQGFKMGATASFVKEWHGARTKLYDDCLYTAYHLPLLSGRGGYRIRSSPVLKDVGGKIVLDEEIERNERRDYHEEYDAEEHEHSVGGRGDNPRRDEVGKHHEDEQQRQADSSSSDNDRPSTGEQGETDSAHNKVQPVVRRISSNVFNYAEMFVFSYGVVVFWNCTERQEKDILADLTFSSSVTTAGPSISLATLPLPEEDFETEEFHFEYSTQISRPRVYNDMITLRSGDHMIKLAISHGIAQSTKLCFFEEAMSKEMAEAKDIPRRLAMTGKLGMKRDEVFRILGRLFKSRVEVNLSSNMLDVPTFFWESEPTLYPLYIAVREYLEIKPRIQVLNERCRVFLDLTEILSDSIADNNESHQTWIIIILIVVSILVTTGEVILRFGLLSSNHTAANPTGPSFGTALMMNLLGRAGPASHTGSLTGAECVCPAVGAGNSTW
ncbi:Sporulation protein RMD8 [Talaromyces islandicus]|uniref:Sporulation protein RMD8 n=1 Tax=Talaromyces islandicus TaxID=28573 RepID=A0A0U1MBA1_TALIS|nr:Sporulation protein RMD8 [Talaromyces islandicus]